MRNDKKKTPTTSSLRRSAAQQTASFRRRRRRGFGTLWAGKLCNDLDALLPTRSSASRAPCCPVLQPTQSSLTNSLQWRWPYDEPRFFFLVSQSSRAQRASLPRDSHIASRHQAHTHSAAKLYTNRHTDTKSESKTLHHPAASRCSIQRCCKRAKTNDRKYVMPATSGTDEP